MSEKESEGVGWMVDSLSEPREEIELRLLRLDIKEMSESLELPALDSPESLSLVMGMTKGSMDTSWRYLERWAHLKEWSASSNSSRSLRRRGTCGMKKKNMNMWGLTSGLETQKSWMCQHHADITKIKGIHYHAHYWDFHWGGGFKVAH